MPPQEQNKTIVVHHRQWGIRRPLSMPEHQVHNLFDELIHQAWCCRQFTAAMDVLETKQNYFVEVELPGILADSIRIHVNGRHLTVEGAKKLVRPETPFEAHLSERCEGNFSRTLQLPEEVDTSQIERLLRDGVLYLKIKKNADARAKGYRHDDSY